MILDAIFPRSRNMSEHRDWNQGGQAEPPVPQGKIVPRPNPSAVPADSPARTIRSGREATEATHRAAEVREGMFRGDLIPDSRPGFGCQVVTLSRADLPSPGVETLKSQLPNGRNG
jgi:hypothetical protein